MPPAKHADRRRRAAQRALVRAAVDPEREPRDDAHTRARKAVRDVARSREPARGGRTRADDCDRRTAEPLERARDPESGEAD